MILAVVISFINLFVAVFNVLILIRVVMSWINPLMSGGFARLVFELTEPILGPIRRVLPQSYGLDFSPLAAFVLLQLLAELANRMLAG